MLLIESYYKTHLRMKRTIYVKLLPENYMKFYNSARIFLAFSIERVTHKNHARGESSSSHDYTLVDP